MIFEVVIIPIGDEEAEAQMEVLGPSPASGPKELPGESRAGGWRWPTQRVDGCPWVLLTELVMQSVIPAMVSTMPASVPGIMDRNEGALSQPCQ